MQPRILYQLTSPMHRTLGVDDDPFRLAPARLVGRVADVLDGRRGVNGDLVRWPGSAAQRGGA
jgi:hypothetical protein